jgi:predicted ATP-binding protein involved in virulence
VFEELHFHPSWQTTIWTMLERWQKVIRFISPRQIRGDGGIRIQIRGSGGIS